MNNPIRRVTVGEDDKSIFVKYKSPFFEDHLIVRPGVPECWGGQKNVFKKGDKVKVQKWNPAMGFFILKKADNSDSEVWQGPRYDNQNRKWVYDK